jgi:hypothetical protein
VHTTASRAILPGFAATRLALFAIATFAVLHGTIDAGEAQRAFRLPPQPNAMLEAWARYDASWYVTIAQSGYRGPMGPYPEDMRSALFPLFPWLVRLVTPLVRNPVLAGLIVSNVCFLVFLVLLWQIVRLDWSDDVARRTMWIYLLFPSAFFLSGVYSESVLLAITAGALLAARRERWIVAGLLAGLAVFARTIGVMAVVPVVIEFLNRPANASSSTPTPRARRSPAMLAGILAPPLVAVVAFLVFVTATFGDPLATFAGQASVRGAMAPPWRPFIMLWQEGAQLHSFDHSLFDAALALVAVATLPLVYARVRPSYACYAGLVVLIPLSGTLISFNRLLLPSFPHAILLALAVERPAVRAALFTSLGLLEAVLLAAFATWHWVA